jgi:hypothetical protein
MSEQKLQLAIENLKKSSLPACPSNLEANVWRKVNLQRAKIKEREQNDFLQWLFNGINRKRTLSYACFASIAYGMIFSGVIIAMINSSHTNDLMELRSIVDAKSLMIGE